MATEVVRNPFRIDNRDWSTDPSTFEPARFALNIRAALEFEPDRLDPDLPPIPETASGVEDLFTAAENVVTGRWIERVSPLLAERCQSWVSQVRALDGYAPGFAEDVALLTDQTGLEQRLRLRQYDLGPTKKALPDVWTSLLLASHERQRAQVDVLRHWSHKLTDEQAGAIGVTKLELEVIVGLAEAATHLNYAYIKQERDAAFLTRGEPLTCEEGEEFVYYLMLTTDPSSGETYWTHTNYEEYIKSRSNEGEFYVEARPFSRVFEHEVTAFVVGLQSALEKLRANEGEIPARYQPFPKVLEKVIQAYATEEVVPENVARLWQEAKSATMALTETDCPLIPIVQGDTTTLGKVAKVIPEFRLGWRTPENRDVEYYISHLRSLDGNVYDLRTLAQEAVAERDPHLAREFSIPQSAIVDVLFGTGSNIHRPTRGDSEPKILIHPNVIKNIALNFELPLVLALLPLESVEEKRFAEAAVLSVLLHEHGQAMFSTWAERVAKRFINAADGYLLDEVKAETCGMLLYTLCWNLGVRLDYQHVFLAMFGRMAESLKDKSGEVGANGERYHYLATPVVNILMSDGVLASGKDVPLQLVDGPDEPRWIRGARALGSRGDEILPEFYMNTGDIAAVENGFRRLKSAPNIAWFRQQLSQVRDL